VRASERVTDADLLEFLRRHGPLRTNQIAARTGIEAQHLRNRLKRLPGVVRTLTAANDGNIWSLAPSGRDEG